MRDVSFKVKQRCPCNPSLWSALISYAMGLNLSVNIISSCLMEYGSEKDSLQKALKSFQKGAVLSNITTIPLIYEYIQHHFISDELTMIFFCFPCPLKVVFELSWNRERHWNEVTTLLLCTSHTWKDRKEDNIAGHGNLICNLPWNHLWSLKP